MILWFYQMLCSLWNVCSVCLLNSVAVADPVTRICVELYLKSMYLFSICCIYYILKYLFKTYLFHLPSIFCQNFLFLQFLNMQKEKHLSQVWKSLLQNDKIFPQNLQWYLITFSYLIVLINIQASCLTLYIGWVHFLPLALSFHQGSCSYCGTYFAKTSGTDFPL